MLAQYIVTPNPQIRPPTDETVMIRPQPAARIEGITAFVTLIVPSTLVSNRCLISSAEQSSVEPRRPTPALLTSP